MLIIKVLICVKNGRVDELTIAFSLAAILIVNFIRGLLE